MKKLMLLAAAVTIAGGAYAQCGDLPTVPTVECAIVYDLRGSLRTTAAKGRTVQDDPCVDAALSCERVRASVALRGFVWSCDCCPDQGVFDSLVWFGKSDTAYSTPTEFDVINVFGARQRDVEALAYMGVEDVFELALGGFGRFDIRNSVVTSLNGQAVGASVASECLIGCEEPIPAVAYPLCALTPDHDVPTVLAGTWSAKHNRQLSEAVVKTAARAVIAGRLPRQIKYIVEGNATLTVQQWIAGT